MAARTVLALLNCRGAYVMLSAVGIALGAVAVREYFIIQRVETEFVETRAEILSAKVERHVTRSRRRTGKVSYRPEVSYVYRVGNQTHNGSEVAWYTPQFSTEVAAEDYLFELCRDGHTVCYVDPADPTSAVLDRHVNRNAFSLLVTFSGAGFLLGVLGVVGLYWFRSVARNRRPTGWNELEEPQHVLLTATPAPSNDPLARTRALMAQYEEGRRPETAGRP